MNLNAYDNVTEKIDKTKTWIDVDKHLLLSREIKFRKYYLFTKRYDTELKTYEYFIVLTDNPIEDRVLFNTRLDDYGRIKIRLHDLYKESGISEFNKNMNISIYLVDKQEDGDIYKLDL